MLVFYKQNLAYFAVPKTGTTSLSNALKPYADIQFGKRFKHMTLGKFHTGLAPFLDKTFKFQPERVAVIRDPVDQLRSWYKYRKRPKIRHTAQSTIDVSFDEFALDAISDKPKVALGAGSQFQFLSIRGGTVPIHHLFAYERQDLVLGFLNDRFDTEFALKNKNVSPDFTADLSPEVEAKLRSARQKDFDLYARVQDNGGVLRDFETT